jgi:hypothetical protein
MSLLKHFKRIFGRGLALAVPVAIVVFVFIRIIGIVEKVILPLAAKLGIEKIWGDITLTLFAIFLIIFLILLFGLLMQITAVSTIRERVEGVIMKFVPSLNQLKLMAADNLDLDTAENTWRPVLLYIKDKAKYSPAFIVEEYGEWITLFICTETSTRNGEILIINKAKISLIPITYSELRWCNRAAGKGYLKIIKAYNTANIIA